MHIVNIKFLLVAKVFTNSFTLLEIEVIDWFTVLCLLLYIINY